MAKSRSKTAFTKILEKSSSPVYLIDGQQCLAYGNPAFFQWIGADASQGETIDETVDRTNLYAAQTPQAFNRKLIQELYEKRNGAQPTDEAQLLELNDQPVAIVEGSPFNIKITTQADLRFAQACLAAMPAAKFDAPIHPFADDNLFR